MTTFHTVWKRQPAVRYQLGGFIAVVRSSTSSRVSLRDNVLMKKLSCSSSGRRPITVHVYHDQSVNAFR